MKAAPGQAAARVFVAVSVDAGLKHAIQRLQEQLGEPCGKHVVRWVKPEQLHLTLKFFGNVGVDQFPELSNALRCACQGVTAFRLAIGGLGCFPSLQRPSVIWLGVSGEVEILGKLQKDIGLATNAFGDHSEVREFSPHLTIGRVKAAGHEARQAGLVIRNTPVGEIGSWDVPGVELIQSTLSPEGSSYRQLASVPFAGH